MQHLTLDAEIKAFSNRLTTTTASFSIGEWICLNKEYKLKEPSEFPVIEEARWTPEQEAYLIESILLGIPIPPITIRIEPDGQWSPISNVMQLGTILSFVDGERIRGETTRLPSLSGMYWKKNKEQGIKKSQALSPLQRIAFNRHRMDAFLISGNIWLKQKPT